VTRQGRSPPGWLPGACPRPSTGPLSPCPHPWGRPWKGRGAVPLATRQRALPARQSLRAVKTRSPRKGHSGIPASSRSAPPPRTHTASKGSRAARSTGGRPSPGPIMRAVAEGQVARPGSTGGQGQEAQARSAGPASGGHGGGQEEDPQDACGHHQMPQDLAEREPQMPPPSSREKATVTSPMDSIARSPGSPRVRRAGEEPGPGELFIDSGMGPPRDASKIKNPGGLRMGETRGGPTRTHTLPDPVHGTAPSSGSGSSCTRRSPGWRPPHPRRAPVPGPGPAGPPLRRPPVESRLRHRHPRDRPAAQETHGLPWPGSSAPSRTTPEEPPPRRWWLSSCATWTSTSIWRRPT